MLNKVMLIGRLGADPEVRYTQSGVPVATLSVATDESYMDKDGNRQEKTEWHRVVVFQRAAENCGKFLGKGSLVYVEGSLQTRKWQDQQGQEHRTTEIKGQRVQFLDRKGDRQRDFAGDEPGQYQKDAGYQRQTPSQQRQNDGAGRSYEPRQTPQMEEDMGPAFPSEAASMDVVPF